MDFVEQIDRLCQAVAAGRTAERRLAPWAAQERLGEAELRLLWALSEAGSLRMHAAAAADQTLLARNLAASPALVSGMVERLAARQLIAATGDPADRRRRLWRLTPAGVELVSRLIDGVAGRDREAAA
jgi:DNA-binding MarR family transcriptional regulator